MEDDKPRLTDDELDLIDRYAREDIERKPNEGTVKRSSRIRRLVEEIRRERQRQERWPRAEG
jgi:hypothetical protein